MLKNQRGMTLVEIMIVLAIIGGLIAVLAPNLVGQQDKAKVKETRIHMNNIISAMEMYNNDCGRYPSKLEYLAKAPGDDECQSWGPTAYMKKEPKDAWNNDYVYESDGGTYTLKSLGKDRKEGGKDFNADIDSENL